MDDLRSGLAAGRPRSGTRLASVWRSAAVRCAAPVALLAAGLAAQQPVPPAVYEDCMLEVGLPGQPSQVTGVALCDLDGDGRLDAAFTEYDGSQAWLYLGFGDASFDKPKVVNVGIQPRWLAAGDLDGDGRADLVTANEYSDSVSVLLGDGAGGVSATASFAAGDGPEWVSLADIDGDGDLDALVAAAFADAVNVLRGDGHGAFLPAKPFAVGDGPRCVTLADFNEDGAPDFVSANDGFPATLTVRLGDGVGGFGSQNTFLDDAGVWQGDWVGVAQTDADAHVDLVVGVSGPGFKRVIVWHGVGDGSFTNVWKMAADTGPRPCLADLDEDGHVDLLMPGLKVAPGDGAGGFASATSWPLLNSPGTAVAAGDLDGDGHLDAVQLHGDVQNPEISIASIARGDGAGGFPLQESLSTSIAPVSRVLAADVDGDGDPDVVSLRLHEGVLVLRNSGAQLVFGSFANLDGTCHDLDVGDLDGDGDPDVVASLQDSLQVLLDDGTGTFVPQAPKSTGLNLIAARCGDADGDGDLDVLLGSNPGIPAGQVRAFLNDGHGALGSTPPLALTSGVQQLLSADFNEDGRADLAWLPYPDGGKPRVSLVLPGGALAEPSKCDISFTADALYAGDVNGDGHVDLVPGSAPDGAGPHAVLLGNGLGGFTTIFDPDNGGANGPGFVRDVDGDGLPDLVAVNEFSLAVLRGDGTAATWSGERYRVGRQPLCAVPIDLDGDGLPEIVAGQQSVPEFVVLRRRPTPAWSDWGHALAGSAGEPQLVGLGTLQGGTTVTLKISDGKPFGSASLVLGSSAVFAAFKGGTLVPSPSLLISGLPLDDHGHFASSGTWTSGLPSGTEIWFQAWIPDAAGPKGFSATNALRGVTP